METRKLRLGQTDLGVLFNEVMKTIGNSSGNHREIIGTSLKKHETVGTQINKINPLIN